MDSQVSMKAGEISRFFELGLEKTGRRSQYRQSSLSNSCEMYQFIDAGCDRGLYWPGSSLELFLSTFLQLLYQISVENLTQQNLFRPKFGQSPSRSSFNHVEESLHTAVSSPGN